MEQLLDANYQAILFDKINAIIEEQKELNIVKTLRAKIFLDGDKWCVLYGENIQEGISAFGDNPMNAVYKFNVAFYTPAPKPSQP